MYFIANLLISSFIIVMLWYFARNHDYHLFISFMTHYMAKINAGAVMLWRFTRNYGYHSKSVCFSPSCS